MYVFAFACLVDQSFLLFLLLYFSFVFFFPQPSLSVSSTLSLCASLGLVLVCTNPDLATLDGAGGALKPMPGALATTYETAMGGRVEWVGKPAKIVFDYADSLARKGAQVVQEEGGEAETQQRQRRPLDNNDKRRTLMIGDSLMHDVKGRCKARRMDGRVRMIMMASRRRVSNCRASVRCVK